MSALDNPDFDASVIRAANKSAQEQAKVIARYEVLQALDRLEAGIGPDHPYTSNKLGTVTIMQLSINRERHRIRNLIKQVKEEYGTDR